jgi:type VI protein secretion system component Hcp
LSRIFLTAAQQGGINHEGREHMVTQKKNRRKKLHEGKKLEERKPLTITKHVDVSSSTLGQGIALTTPRLGK